MISLQRNAERPPHSSLIDGGLDNIFVDFLDNKRYGNDKIGFYLLESFHQDLGGGDFSQKCDMGSHGGGREEVEGTTVGMG